MFLGVLISFTLVGLPGPSPAFAKEFVVVGEIDCGVRSDRNCPPVDGIVPVRSEHFSGVQETRRVHWSWIKPADRPDFEQDEQVCVEVSDHRTDGVQQAIGIPVNCDELGSFNPGLDKKEQQKRNKERNKDGAIGLTASATDSPDPVRSGQPLTFSASVQNSTNQDVTNAIIRLRQGRQPGTFTSVTFISLTAPPEFNCVSTPGGVDFFEFECRGTVRANSTAQFATNNIAGNPGPHSLTVTVEPGGASATTNNTIIAAAGASESASATETGPYVRP